MSNEDPFDNGKYKGVDPYYQTDPKMLDADPEDGVEGQSADEVEGQGEKKSETSTAGKDDGKADSQTATGGQDDGKADGQAATPKSAPAPITPAAPKK
ncbi:hypothetical protein SEA_REYNAULD_22 [Rhodococcus phage Reynauld]|uniref:Uncharacterized protein n=1 Tax=Rhodococcus phage Reynauld TaxID=3062845 RepID=A0ACD4UHI8_9CAUD|nr:hypothetical protein SEA_REYNAULD_22 [Rhodococcus phage Reynauld]